MPMPTDSATITQPTAQATQPTQAVSGFSVNNGSVSKEDLARANETLKKYKEGKQNLENKIVENDKWYRIRHWEVMNDEKQDMQPKSAWLFNCIANKHADAMDNYPEPNILPREEGDKQEATMLTSIIPVVLEHCEFEQVYSDVWTYKLKTGTGVYGAFWNPEKLNGLGDIDIQKIDLLNLFWQPGITDIQKSRNLFHIELVDNDLLEETYPQLKGKVGKGNLEVAEYSYDDKVDTDQKSIVIDWYYHKLDENTGKKILHYCKYVNEEVIFATENNPDYPEGWYKHGLYPFVFDVLFDLEGTPAGFGYIDIGKDTQAYIDRGNQVLLESLFARGKARWLVKNDSAINEEELMDLTKDVVHTDGDLGDNSIRPLSMGSMGGINERIVLDKIDELKETTGNRDISNGGTSSGVTAASAIAAMQEAGSKLSRDAIKSSYRAYSKIIYMVIELIRQFYDMPRQFRIVGENGAEQFASYTNEGIQPQPQGTEFGVDLGFRLPQFDIKVSPQKQSPYAKMSQNELALQFFNMGFFNPEVADQALACLDMMDFDRKEFVIRKIQQIQMKQQMMMQQQMLMGGMPIGMPMNAPMPQGNGEMPNLEGGESSITSKARQRVADSTAPR